MQTRTSDSHVIAALVKYAQVRDTPSFDAAIDVYIAWGKTVDYQDRLLLCQAMNDAIRSRQGHGFEALLPFIVVDPDPQVVANAALKTAVLFPARHTDHLEAPRFVAHLTRGREHFSRGEFASEIVDRLDYLCVTEAVTEKVMPLACLLSKGLGE